MTIKKFDLSGIKKDIFYERIYPLYAREFLFGDDYMRFELTVSANFILSSDQWQHIIEHWELKEDILKIETR